MTVLCAAILSGCGTSKSLEPTNGVLHAVVTVRDSLIVTGPILSEDASSITIVAYGVTHTYEKAAVQDIQRVLGPDNARMQQEMLVNSKKTASNTGVIMMICLIGIALATWVTAVYY
jgi:hypothetical protein